MNQESNNQTHPILGIPSNHLPRHIAIIMDGNGRWAQKKGLPRVKGHGKGSLVVRPIVIESVRLGIECLTFYSFSTENWKRPPAEVDTIMDLYRQYLIEERPMVMEYNVRVRHLGEINELPERVVIELEKTLHASRNNTGMTLCLALNYSGRSEIVRAFNKINHDISQGKLPTDKIDESLIDNYLDTAGLPDPDLLIRTAGEKRISNFLLWQISYAELYITDVYWPDFNPQTLTDAILDYAGRNRRFGGLKTGSS